MTSAYDDFAYDFAYDSAYDPLMAPQKIAFPLEIIDFHKIRSRPNFEGGGNHV